MDQNPGFSQCLTSELEDACLTRLSGEVGHPILRTANGSVEVLVASWSLTLPLQTKPLVNSADPVFGGEQV